MIEQESPLLTKLDLSIWWSIWSRAPGNNMMLQVPCYSATLRHDTGILPCPAYAATISSYYRSAKADWRRYFWTSRIILQNRWQDRYCLPPCIKDIWCAGYGTFSWRLNIGCYSRKRNLTSKPTGKETHRELLIAPSYSTCSWKSFALFHSIATNDVTCVSVAQLTVERTRNTSRFSPTSARNWLLNSALQNESHIVREMVLTGKNYQERNATITSEMNIQLIFQRHIQYLCERMTTSLNIPNILNRECKVKPSTWEWIGHWVRMRSRVFIILWNTIGVRLTTNTISQKTNRSPRNRTPNKCAMMMKYVRR